MEAEGATDETSPKQQFASFYSQMSLTMDLEKVHSLS
jgi:hypothetical protein